MVYTLAEIGRRALAHDEEPAEDLESLFRRACCLGALLDRVIFEGKTWANADAERREKAAAFIRSIPEWLKKAGALAALSPTEERLLTSERGSWTDDECMDISWRAECLGILAWSMNLLEAIPPYDTESERFEGFSARLDDADFAKLRARIRLRSPEEFAEALAMSDAWHWRSVQAEELFISEEASALDPTAREAAVAQALRGDAELFGKPYGQLTVDEFLTARSIAIERHYVFGWIWEGGPWDEVDTDPVGLD